MLTTNKIAERAGVSIGSLYQYFPNKQAIARALLEREVKRAEALRPAVLDDASAPHDVVVRAAVEWWFAVHMIDPALAQHLNLLASSLLPEEERARLTRLRHERLRRTVARLIDDQTRLDEVTFVFDVCLAALSAQALARRPGWLTSEKFRNEVTVLLSRYVR